MRSPARCWRARRNRKTRDRVSCRDARACGLASGALGLSLLFMLLVRGKYSWRAFAGVVARGIGIHIVGDVITAFGTMIFAPFSTWRAQIPTTFIIDPYFTAIIVAGLIR